MVDRSDWFGSFLKVSDHGGDPDKYDIIVPSDTDFEGENLGMQVVGRSKSAVTSRLQKLADAGYISEERASQDPFNLSRGPARIWRQFYRDDVLERTGKPEVDDAGDFDVQAFLGQRDSAKLAEDGVTNPGATDKTPQEVADDLGKEYEPGTVTNRTTRENQQQDQTQQQSSPNGSTTPAAGDNGLLLAGVGLALLWWVSR